MRYKATSQAHAGDRVVFDNSGGYKPNLPRIRMVGEVQGTISDKVIVRFGLLGITEPIDIQLPFHLLR